MPTPKSSLHSNNSNSTSTSATQSNSFSNYYLSEPHSAHCRKKSSSKRDHQFMQRQESMSLPQFNSRISLDSNRRTMKGPQSAWGTSYNTMSSSPRHRPIVSAAAAAAAASNVHKCKWKLNPPVRPRPLGFQWNIPSSPHSHIFRQQPHDSGCIQPHVWHSTRAQEVNHASKTYPLTTPKAVSHDFHGGHHSNNSRRHQNNNDQKLLSEAYSCPFVTESPQRPTKAVSMAEGNPLGAHRRDSLSGHKLAPRGHGCGEESRYNEESKPPQRSPCYGSLGSLAGLESSTVNGVQDRSFLYYETPLEDDSFCLHHRLSPTTPYTGRANSMLFETEGIVDIVGGPITAPSLSESRDSYVFTPPPPVTENVIEFDKLFGCLK